MMTKYKYTGNDIFTCVAVAVAVADAILILKKTPVHRDIFFI
tara:strand:- start:47 stop:172 length:126 start_codon:yes stop_codon:yes gene_type:complete